MIVFNNIKTIIFDYDGTLHNSIKIYEPAFKKAYSFLEEKGYVQKKDWKTEEIVNWLGYSSKDMWDKFLPQLPAEIKNQASKIIGEEMNRLTKDGRAQLYPNTLEILKYLKQKRYLLVFLSNCGLYYMEIHKKIFSLDLYFDHMICSEQYDFIPKYEILEKIIKQFPKEVVIIGDRFHDIETGKKNNIYSIGCEYGFGNLDELNDADLLIDDIKILMNYF